MSDINVQSHEELLHFANGLSNLSQGLIFSFAQANTEMDRVNEGWNDEQNTRFMHQFRQATTAIHNIAGMMEEYSAFIRRYAAAIEAAKNVR